MAQFAYKMQAQEYNITHIVYYIVYMYGIRSVAVMLTWLYL